MSPITTATIVVTVIVLVGFALGASIALWWEDADWCGKRGPLRKRRKSWPH